MNNNEEAQELIKTYMSTFKSQKGKDILMDMSKMSGIFSVSDDLSPTAMAFREGQRSILFRIFSMISMEKEQIVELFSNKNPWEGEDYE